MFINLIHKLCDLLHLSITCHPYVAGQCASCTLKEQSAIIHGHRTSCTAMRVSITTHTHTHPFNGPLSGTTRVSRYQTGKTNLDFTEARDSEWQRHQLSHMQVRILLQTDSHARPHHSVFFTDRMPFLSPNQQRQSTERN